MKKIFIILLCMLTLNANATEMCARNDTVVIPLDATIEGITRTYDITESLVWVEYEYGTLYGSIACLSKKEIMIYSDWNGSGNNLPAVLNTSSDELVGASGYYMNANVDPDIPDDEKPDYARNYCFGKITHPMSTSWELTATFAVDNCPRECLMSVSRQLQGKEGKSFRTYLFNSIGTVPPWSE